MSRPWPRCPGTGLQLKPRWLLLSSVLVRLWLMNGSRQWCRWFQILWLSKPLQTLVPEPFSPLDMLRERQPLSPPCHRNQFAFGVIRTTAILTGAAVVRWRWGLGLGAGWWLQPCFLSLTKHRSLCEGKISLTPRNRDLVLEGRFLQSGPTTAAMTDVLITRSFKEKRAEGSAGKQALQWRTWGHFLELPGRDGRCLF